MEKDFIREELLIAMKKYNIKLDTLSKMTKIEQEDLEKYLNNNQETYEFAGDKYGLLFKASTFLSQPKLAMESEDDRLKSIIEVLNSEYNISNKSISLYAEIDEKYIEKFIEKKCIPYEIKYKISVISFSLLNLFTELN